MNHTATVRNIDPALDQLRVCLAVAVSDNPLPQTKLTHQAGVQAPVRVIMPMKPDIRIFGRVIIGEIASPAAQEHPRTRRIAIAGHGRPQAMLAQELASLVAGRRITAGRVAQDHGVDFGRFGERFLNFSRLVADNPTAENELVADDFQLHCRCAHRQQHQGADQDPPHQRCTGPCGRKRMPLRRLR